MTTMNETGRGLRRGRLSFVFSAFTTRPSVWKAHGTAGLRSICADAEPRPAGLIQSASAPIDRRPKAVLEQPSSRRMTGQTLGRRNIALADKRAKPEREGCVESTRTSATPQAALA